LLTRSEQYLDYERYIKKFANPTDAIYYRKGSTKPALRYGLLIHLATILPAGFLVVFQFVPIIRHKVILFHRINGYICLILLFVSNAGAFALMPAFLDYDAFGQISVGVLGVSTCICAILAYVNIKRLQIDQHRAWILRTWVYAASVISLRIIQIAAQHTINRFYPDRFWRVYTCGKIFDIYRTYGVPDLQNPTPIIYPVCAPNGPASFDPTIRTPVPANKNPILIAGQLNPATPEMNSALISITFSLSFWVAFVLHVLAVEVYLRMTPRETARLKQVSYERQLARGMKNPGNAGLTVERFGDAEKWIPKTPAGMARKESQTSDSD
jgi:hypothetical protein